MEVLFGEGKEKLRRWDFRLERGRPLPLLVLKLDLEREES